MINAMLLSIGLGMVAMCVILAAEILIVGANQGRLSWPYGDLVPGNYLAKACLPAFVVVVAIATSSNGRTASWAAIIAPDFHCGFGHDRGTHQFSYSRLQQHAGYVACAPDCIASS